MSVMDGAPLTAQERQRLQEIEAMARLDVLLDRELTTMTLRPMRRALARMRHTAAELVRRVAGRPAEQG
ncbi:hypothetical protein P3T36_002360 [Kitasatospora sp. MAP12-15]|uniref:hypothetical protein n=1 Tax=unclassified Kitasatospora TaxID=2633591 RepID=UPI0024738B3A|nr:hypothetical protein [Kitasatospora sp. MAP12-44]MDH6108719.1 hypothetical protein [Kitasatospora sp. MAP12-44]